MLTSDGPSVFNAEVSAAGSSPVSVTSAAGSPGNIAPRPAPKALSRKGAGVGLKNIMERYRYLTDRKVDVVQSDSRFIVRVPLLEFRS